MVKIVCLGNEFIEGDSLAKAVGERLADDFEVVMIKDSFQLMSLVGSNAEFVILDVVQGLEDVRKIRVDDLKVDSILSAHDFDASYVLKLAGEKMRIIGIPMIGDVLKIRSKVEELILEKFKPL